MRKLLAVLLLVAVPVVLISADRDPGTYSLGGFGGMVMPMGPKGFKDYFKSGIGFGGEFKYNVNPTTSLGLSYTYVGFKAKEDAFRTLFEGMLFKPAGTMTITIDPYTVSIISANFIKYFTQPEASTGFYLTLGGGYYMMKSPDVKVEMDGISDTEKGEKENRFGLNGGLGMEIKAGQKMNFFVEGKYHYVFTKDESNSNNSDSGKLNFITILAGLRFALGQ